MSPSVPAAGPDCYPEPAFEVDLLSALRPFDLIEYDYGFGMCDQHRDKRNRKLKEKFLPMYKAGLPLFTKPMLEEVGKQIRTFQHKDCDQTIYVTGIDGKKYAFNVGHGPVSVFPPTAGIEGVRSVHTEVAFRCCRRLLASVLTDTETGRTSQSCIIPCKIFAARTD